jgi:hypothetical protein
LSDVLNSDFHCEHDPSKEFTNGNGILVNGFNAKSVKILLEELKLLVLSEVLVFGTNDALAVLIHLEE